MTYIKDLVSVVIVTYNYKTIIRETLDSVLNQTYKNLQIIVSDDGSTDGTQDIISEYANLDSRIIPVFAEKNQGLSYNMNKGLEKCAGEFIAKLDGDDQMLPTKIEKQVHFLVNNLDYVLCLSDMEVFDSLSGKKMHNLSDIAPLAQSPHDWCLFTNWFFLRKEPSFVYSSVLARSNYLLQTYWDVRVPLHNENLHLIGNFALNPKGKWYVFQEVLGRYRYSPNSMSQTKREHTVLLEEAFISNSISAIKFPQIAGLTKNRKDFILFTYVLYNWLPEGSSKYYEKLFLLEAGLLKYIYLKVCKTLLRLKMLSLFTAPGRLFYRKFIA